MTSIWMEACMGEFLKKMDSILWGPGMLFFLLGSGVYLLIKLRFLPIRRLGYALSCVLKPESETAKGDGISARSSLTTELAATIGTGNIVGVATAMVLGGPGALLWMILAALVGLSTKFAESMLSVAYRRRDKNGQYAGGPMYTLSGAFPNGVGKLGGILFSVFAVFASFGMGNMTQSNSISESLSETFSISPVHTGIILTVLVIFALLGGIKSIAGITLYLVPFMALFYCLGTVFIILLHIDRLPEAAAALFTGAFSGRAAAGGICGMTCASMQEAMRFGVSRGVFSNEAGLGAAGITAAAADTDSPVRQGYISMTGVFFDTILICSLTGLALLTSGVLGMQEGGEPVMGAALMIAVFSTGFGSFGGCFVSIGIALFAFATIIAWEYQGECAFSFLTGGRACMEYRFIYAAATFLGAVCSLEAVWDFADCMNALMAVPNLLCVLALSNVVYRKIVLYDKIHISKKSKYVKNR